MLVLFRFGLKVLQHHHKLRAPKWSSSALLKMLLIKSRDSQG